MSIQGEWKLKRVDEDQISGDTVLHFQEDRLSYGYGNRYFHTFSINGSNINIGPGAGTRMFCHMNPPERTVTGAIQESNQWQINGDSLVLSKDGKPRVILQRV